MCEELSERGRAAFAFFCAYTSRNNLPPYKENAKLRCKSVLMAIAIARRGFTLRDGSTIRSGCADGDTLWFWWFVYDLGLISYLPEAKSSANIRRNPMQIKRIRASYQVCRIGTTYADGVTQTSPLCMLCKQTHEQDLMLLRLGAALAPVPSRFHETPSRVRSATDILLPVVPGARGE